MEKACICPDMIEAYRAALLESEKSAATTKKYLRSVQRFTDFCGGRRLDKSLVLSYKTELEKRYTPVGANAALAAINGFLRFCGCGDCCAKPFKVQRKLYCREERELSREEYVRLVKAAEDTGDQRMALLLATICSTGIRVSELSYITVEAVRQGEATVTCKGKSRTVFLPAALRKRLRQYAHKHGLSSGPVFVTRTGRPMDRSNIWQEMKALCRRANVLPSKVFPHSLRKLFARTFYKIDHDVARLADILGHSSINTTRIYIMTSGVEHRRKMERMHLVI